MLKIPHSLLNLYNNELISMQSSDSKVRELELIKEEDSEILNILSRQTIKRVVDEMNQLIMSELRKEFNVKNFPLTQAVYFDKGSGAIKTIYQDTVLFDTNFISDNMTNDRAEILFNKLEDERVIITRLAYEKYAAFFEQLVELTERLSNGLKQTIKETDFKEGVIAQLLESELKQEAKQYDFEVEVVVSNIQRGYVKAILKDSFSAENIILLDYNDIFEMPRTAFDLNKLKKLTDEEIVTSITKALIKITTVSLLKKVQSRISSSSENYINPKKVENIEISWTTKPTDSFYCRLIKLREQRNKLILLTQQDPSEKDLEKVKKVVRIITGISQSNPEIFNELVGFKFVEDSEKPFCFEDGYVNINILYGEVLLMVDMLKQKVRHVSDVLSSKEFILGPALQERKFSLGVFIVPAEKYKTAEGLLEIYRVKIGRYEKEVKVAYLNGVKITHNQYLKKKRKMNSYSK